MTVAGIWAKTARVEEGKRRQAKGERAELLVVKALSRKTRPAWIVHVFRTEQYSKLDRRGIDVIVKLEDGRSVRLQVKSSAFAAKRFREKRPDLESVIGIVIVRESDDLNTIYGKALGAILLLLDPELRAIGGAP